MMYEYSGTKSEVRLMKANKKIVMSAIALTMAVLVIVSAF